ncbi:hypothetical protein V1291_004246 [Nitrobacteraceae bacterium AZCC 1564]
MLQLLSSHQMIVRLQKIDNTARDDSHSSRQPSAEPLMIAEHANIPPLSVPAESSNRRLRNGLILANVVAWIGIIIAIRVIFF